MASAGELLRAERLKRNRNLADIARETCISQRYLEAIEVDRVQDLPGEFFYRSFLRQYADALELDSSMTSKVLASAIPMGENDPLPVMNQVYENAQVGARRQWKVPLVVAVGLLIGAALLASATYAWWQRWEESRQTAATTPAPVASAPPSPAPAEVKPAEVKPAEVKIDEPPKQDQAPTTPAASTPTAAPVPTPAPATGAKVLEVTATEPVWLSVQSEGKTVFSGTLEASQSRQFEIGETGKLVTGNAAGVSARWNGAQVGEIGPRGQVRTVLLTSHGAQVVAPRPKIPATPTPTP